MTLPAHAVRHDWRAYLALEAASNIKHEHLDGQIYAMAGGTPEHAALTAATTIAIGAALRRGRCRAYSSDLRIRVLATGLATYPDVTVVCGPREVDPEDKNTITNPTLLVEVLSPSTEDYDRGEKFAHYKRIPSLQQVVLVSHEDRCVEVWTRGAKGWTRAVSRDGEVAKLGSIDALLVVRELYDAAVDEPAGPAPAATPVAAAVAVKRPRAKRKTK